jgi:hypothetical protein
MSKSVKASVAVVLLLLVVQMVWSGDSWAGKVVSPLQREVRIGYTGPDGQQVYVATLTGASYRVLADKDGWIKVRAENGKEGWFDKSEAELFDGIVLEWHHQPSVLTVACDCEKCGTRCVRTLLMGITQETRSGSKYYSWSFAPFKTMEEGVALASNPKAVRAAIDPLTRVASFDNYKAVIADLSKKLPPK